MSTKDLFTALGPVEWEDVSSRSVNLADYVNEKLFQGRAIAASVPGSRLPTYTAADTTVPRPESSSACQDARIARLPEHPQLTSHAQLYSEVLLKEWKPVKVGKENTLGINVFRMAPGDARGAWFARRSLHRELPFERWVAAFRGEFGEAVRCGTVVRGMAAAEVLEHRKAGLSNMTVYRMAAQFPGPTAPRDFVSMVLSAESRSPVSESTNKTCPLREFIVVSKPCTHARCEPISGTIRGTYESVELVREVLVNGDGDGGVSDNGDKSTAWSAGVAVEWVMVTRSDPGGSVPRFMIERGTPAGICTDATKFFKWMRTTDLSAYDTLNYIEDDDDQDTDMLDENKEPVHEETPDQMHYDNKAAAGVATAGLHHGGKHKNSLAPPSPNPKRRRSSDRHSMASLNDVVANGTTATHADSDSDSDDDDMSFVSALSELDPTPPPPSSLPSSTALSTRARRLQRHSHYTFPITHTDSSVEPPRLSAEWMSSTEEIAVGLATRHAVGRRQRHRVLTAGMAGYEERSLHRASASPDHHRSHHYQDALYKHTPHRSRHETVSSGSTSSLHAAAPPVALPPHKEHRSLADRLLGRHPSNTYTKDEERQLKALAKAQQREEKAAHKRFERQRKQERDDEKHHRHHNHLQQVPVSTRRDSTTTASTGSPSVPSELGYYNAVPGRYSGVAREHDGNNDAIPRSTDNTASQRAEMDVLKQQLVLLQDQNALLAGRLSQMGLENDEICNVATVHKTSHHA